MPDWRLPENRREAFLRFYEFHLQYEGHPGAVYQLLPAIADAYDLDEDGRAWLVWLNGNTENVVTSLLLLEAAPTIEEYEDAIQFWNEHFRELEWDTDRRHQKSKFGEATHQWAAAYSADPATDWRYVGAKGWDKTWEYAFTQPYMGRLSAWSMIEYARILFGRDAIPDAGSFLLEDKAGSRSHRNGLAVIAGYPDAAFWDADIADMLGITPGLNDLAEDLLLEAHRRIRHPDVSRLTMESALCTYKSWHKPNRRYPNVYHDMMYNRIRRGEKHFGKRFDVLWEAREALPELLRLECNPRDPGAVPAKQNWYRETGEIHYLHLLFDDMRPSGFEEQFDDYV